jgi:hypothetical protein
MVPSGSLKKDVVEDDDGNGYAKQPHDHATHKTSPFGCIMPVCLGTGVWQHSRKGNVNLKRVLRALGIKSQ